MPDGLNNCLDCLLYVNSGFDKMLKINQNGKLTLENPKLKVHTLKQIQIILKLFLIT